MTEATAANGAATERLVPRAMPKKPPETKREKFERIARARTIEAIRRIRMLAALGRNRADYEFDDNDIASIVHRLQYELMQMEYAFARKPQLPPVDFSFTNAGVPGDNGDDTD